MNARTATVAVTGIGGFVGRHVALALLREGYPVHGTVRASGAPRRSSDPFARPVVRMPRV
ncbi:hypothetical protein N185_29365 [Sinorhizobium sp. GW3]|nr:hypothetical protein N185_29365 [Sinorhizobium sp. GW3]